MNKTSHCTCEDCKCDPCECGNNVSCHNNSGCHCGHHFWFWAIIRIAIVVGLIIGAYYVGTISRMDRFDRGYSSNYDRRSMMTPTNTKNDPKEEMMREHCKSMPTMMGCQNYISKNGPEMNHSMMSMSMEDMAKMLEWKTGDDLDRAFLEGMIPHHQGAVDMAKYLTGAKHPELQKMWQDIITTQNKEIEQMKKWMKEWGYTATGSTPQ